MAKITSKLQVTIPKAIADAYGLKPGDEIEFQAAGNMIRVVPPGRRRRKKLGLEERLRLFDESIARQEERVKRLWSGEQPKEREAQPKRFARMGSRR